MKGYLGFFFLPVNCKKTK